MLIKQIIIEPIGGECIDDVIKYCINLHKMFTIEVISFRFNGVDLFIKPKSNFDLIIESYYTLLQGVKHDNG